MYQAPYYEITKTIYNIPLIIYLHKKSPIQIIEPHWHRALELTIVFEGEVDFYNGSHHEVLRKDEVSLTNSEVIHYSVPNFDTFEDRVVGYTMQINYEFLESLIPNIQGLYFDISNKDINTKIASQMKEIYNLYISQKEVKYIKIYAVTLEIISLLYENCQRKKVFVTTKKTKEIIKYIHEHYRENLLLCNVANYFGFSREYFSRFFKKEIGFSFKQYLISYRLTQSLNLLESTSKTIVEIALSVGFSNETQFIKHFKNSFKLTPGQYRKSLFNYKNINKLI